MDFPFDNNPSLCNIEETPSCSHSNDDDNLSALSLKERRREAHIQAEQKRRDSIKKGYDALQAIVPTCKDSHGSAQKLSKAVVLQKSIDYINYQLNQKNRDEQERDSLRKELMGLQIMLVNYQQIVKSHGISAPNQTEQQLTDEDKFAVFQDMMDRLFLSFDRIPVDNFANFSTGVFNWVENYCKPNNLHAIIHGVLRDQNYTE